MELSKIWDKMVEILAEAVTLNTNTSTMVSDVTTIKDYTKEIDNQAVGGLNGTLNSLAYRVHEIERHLHSGARWFETATTPSGETHVADRIGSGSGSFQLDGGNDSWGSWVQIIGSEDTPVRTDYKYFDPHQIIIEDTENASVYFLQFSRGDSGAAGLAAGTYTELIYSASVQKETGIIQVQTGRAPAGSKIWARCWSVGDNTGTFNFFMGIHEYEG